MNDIQFLEREFFRWVRSPKRGEMLEGDRYYRGEHDILSGQRTVIGEGGQPEAARNLPDNRVVDNQYAKVIDQKVNYLLGKSILFDTDSERFEAALKGCFGREFQRLLRYIGTDSLNGGISWLYPYIDRRGRLSFRRFKSYEVLPFWRDSFHTELDSALRFYQTEAYEGDRRVTIQRAELYLPGGVRRFIIKDGRFLPDTLSPGGDYITCGDQGFSWGRVPLIPFRSSSGEQSLLRRVKVLQDSLNSMISELQNRLQEDAHNTILVLKNYDGQDLGEFRRNLAAYGAVKVRSGDGAEGGIDTLRIEADIDGYEYIINMLRRAIIENGRGYDAKADKFSSDPNQLNILSMYSDIDLDADAMELEYQASFERLLEMVRMYFYSMGLGDFSRDKVRVIFNRDMMISESSVISDIKNSVGLLSNKTLIAQHPYVDDLDRELKRIKAERG